MIGYILALTLQTGLLCVIGWWYVRAYRKAAHRSRREVERLVAASKSTALEAEVEYLRRRQEILLAGLFPKGEVFLGNFIDQDPELQALCELLELVRAQQIATGTKSIPPTS